MVLSENALFLQNDSSDWLSRVLTWRLVFRFLPDHRGGVRLRAAPLRGRDVPTQTVVRSGGLNFLTLFARLSTSQKIFSVKTKYPPFLGGVPFHGVLATDGQCPGALAPYSYVFPTLVLSP